MKRALLVASMFAGSAGFAQGFVQAEPSRPPLTTAQPVDAQQAAENEFADSHDAQQVEAAGSGDAQWQSVPPPPPTPEEIEETPMAEETVAPPATAPTQEQFDQALSPYGQWVNDPNMGRVWQPDPNEVGQDFVPYSTGGTWVNSSYGWSFNTGWGWGWAPFHYGRWYRNPSYGWVWTPGNQWGSSWVDWRCSGGYVAWAPLGPRGYGLGFALGVPGWNFVARHNFWHPYVAYHQIYPHYGGGRYSWSHAPAFHSAPAWHASSRSWSQPSWHSAAPWHANGGHWGSPTGRSSHPSYSAPHVSSGGGSRMGGGFHGGGGGHSSGGGGHHR